MNTSSYYVLRKRFRQFRALFQALDSLRLTQIEGSSIRLQGPLKYSYRKSRTSLSKDNGAKVSIRNPVY